MIMSPSKDGFTRLNKFPKDKKNKDPPKHPYIWVTARSAYEPCSEHYDDIKQMKPSSHMLKHLIDRHEKDNCAPIDFRLDIMSLSRTRYEQQYEYNTIPSC